MSLNWIEPNCVQTHYEVQRTFKGLLVQFLKTELQRSSKPNFSGKDPPIALGTLARVR